MSNEIVVVQDLAPDVVRGQMTAIHNFQSVIQNTLTQNVDYGKIPGCGDKPALFKSGAEKITMALGLTSEFEIIEKKEDFETGIAFYEIRCVLKKNGTSITQGLGSCSTMEGKYRWRWVPEWDDSIKGLDMSKVVYKDKKTRDGRPYKLYKLDNDDVFTQWNTVLKMAKKRSFVDAALTVGSLSNLFTQDIEEWGGSTVNAEVVETSVSTPTHTQEHSTTKMMSEKQRDLIKKLIKGLNWTGEKTKEVLLEKFKKEKGDELTSREASTFITFLKEQPAGKVDVASIREEGFDGNPGIEEKAS